MKGINPQQLRYFYEVLEHRSIRTAAEVLNTAPSVVTRQIKQLEKELAVTLFERRHKRGMAPTEAGEALAEYYRNNCEQREQLDNHFRQIRDAQRGTIYFAISEGYILPFMDEILCDFMRQYPDIQINLRVDSASGIVTAVAEDTAHIGLAYNPPSDPLIQSCKSARRLATCVVVSKTHPLAHKRTVAFSEAAQYPAALMTPAFTSRKIVQQLEIAENIPLKPTIETNYLGLTKRFAKAGYGVTFMTPFHQEIKNGELIALEIDVPVSPTHTNLIVRKDRPLSPAAHELLTRASRLSIFNSPLR